MKKTYDSKFRRCVALETMREESTIAEIAGKYQIHPNQVQHWKQRLIEGVYNFPVFQMLNIYCIF